jgi:glycosyltransferase involved in cell wall biosynthesis
MRIDIYGLFQPDSGWGTHARGFAAALGRGHDVRAIAWDADPSFIHVPGAEVPFAEPDPEADFAVCIGPLDQTHRVLGRYRIAFHAWETTVLPTHHRHVLADFDEIWTPSRWGREVVIANGFQADRVHVVPEGVDTALFAPNAAATDAVGGGAPFRFLCVGKWEERKGIAGLVKCFRSTFDQAEAELVLHVHNPYLPGFTIEDALSRVDVAPGSLPPVTPSPPVSRGGMAALYRQCDAFVLPTRAEGWGLPILEAMASGLPVIATHYSAPVDYLDATNGYPLNVAAMTPVYDPFFYSVGEWLGDWAEPDWNHLRQRLRQVFEAQGEARAKGRKARQDVERLWSWEKAAEAAVHRLGAIVSS